ncbi:phospholipase D-like domain-containing protein [Sulfuracidifex metallicus]|uniref:phospholipase D-like domain-containing protein n=1 Tax=Sulfuracidifex metallicus TaxID=47303 RepID=UPI0006D20BC3|nr:phospholipase D-like domain-containing protein [Sulfuracidifex metallicus]
MHNITLVLLSLVLVSFAVTVVGSTSSNWYVSINPSQVTLIVGPTNSSYIIHELKQAKTSVYSEIYELTCTEIVENLAELARQGVNVYVVLSGSVYGGIPSDEKQYINLLNSSGVHVKFQYDFTFVHSKVYVIDNKTVILGSMNPTYYGMYIDKSIDIAIHNSSIAKVYAGIILRDFENEPLNSINYPGVVVSPINSYNRISYLLSQQGTLYIAMEELYPSSGLFNEIASHKTVIGVVSDYSEDSEASSQFGLKQLHDMVAKVIVVGNYVYIGSINLDSTSLTKNRELGIIIKDPLLASELKYLIVEWGGKPYHVSFFDKYKVYIIIAIVIILILLTIMLKRYRNIK